MDRLQVDRCEAGDLDQLLTSMRQVQAAVEATIIRIGMRADELAATGSGAPARDTLLADGRVRAATARREAGRASLAGRSPALGRAMASGRLGPDHLDALVRRLGPLDDEHLERVASSGLLQRAAALPADTFAAALARLVETTAQDDSRQAAEPGRTASEVRHWFDHRTGLGHLAGRFDPERYEAIVTALDQHAAALANDRGGDRGHESTVMNSALVADALVDLICASGHRRPNLPHITVVVDQATLERGRHEATIAQTGDGLDLGDEAISRLCCDAVLRRVVLDERGVPIAVGRRYRTATDAQWAAIRAAHQGCAWAGCDRPLSRCQAHHIRYWHHGGATDLDNLVPLCAHHHHLVHDGRWHLHLEPDRSLRITRPDGQRYTTTDPPTRRPPPLLPPLATTAA